jgi:hypothetical protein
VASFYDSTAPLFKALVQIEQRLRKTPYWQGKEAPYFRLDFPGYAQRPVPLARLCLSCICHVS